MNNLKIGIEEMKAKRDEEGLTPRESRILQDAEDQLELYEDHLKARIVFATPAPPPPPTPSLVSHESLDTLIAEIEKEEAEEENQLTPEEYQDMVDALESVVEKELQLAFETIEEKEMRMELENDTWFDEPLLGWEARLPYGSEELEYAELYPNS